jgi:hypothetical protein
LREDRGVDEPGDVVERAQVGGVDHGLDAAALGDDAGGGLILRRGGSASLLDHQTPRERQSSWLCWLFWLHRDDD